VERETAKATTASAAKRRQATRDEGPVVADHGSTKESTANSVELAVQNRLFAEAMRIHEKGDLLATVRLLDDFIRRYSSSPLAEDAYVERFRTLSQMGEREAAARAARSYLALYIDGFAREEASGVLLGGGLGP
jgi:hypothetical protein